MIAGTAHAAISSLPDDPTWVGGSLGAGFAVAPDGDRAWVAGAFPGFGTRTGPGVAIGSAGQTTAGYPELTDAGFPLSVDAVVADGSHGWYVAGNFSKAGGINRPGLVHLRQDGSVDTAFDAQAGAGTIKALALSGGLLYAGGTFATIGGQARLRLAALDPATGNATGWQPDVTGFNVQSIAIGGGFAWVGGFFNHIGATAVTNVAKVALGNTAVDADGTWLPAPNGQVHAVLFTPANIFLGGDFTSLGGVVGADRVAKTDLTGGAVDAAWLPAANGSVYALAQDGTNIYVGGSFSALGLQTRVGLAAVLLSNLNGGGAESWYPGDTSLLSTVKAMAYDGIGTVYFGGDFTTVNGAGRGGLASAPADATGALSSWNPSANDGVNTLAADATTGLVYAGGRFTGVGAVRHIGLEPIDMTTGAAMPYFAHDVTGLADNVYAVAACGNTVVIGGSFAFVDGVGRLNAAAFDRNTGALLPWNPDFDNDVRSLACGNGVVYIGGNFVHFNDSSTKLPQRGGLAAVDLTTFQPTAWDPGEPGGGTDIEGIAVRGSTVYVGGLFANAGSPLQPRSEVAALDAASGAATAFDPNVAGGVSTIALGTDKLYIGGQLTTVGVTPRTRAAAVFLSDGSVDPGFAPAPSSIVRGMAVAPDGTVYMGGDFTDFGGTPRLYAAAVTPTGALTSWSPGPDATVDDVATDPGGRVYLAGHFSGFSGRASSVFATFSEPTSFASGPSVSPAPVEGQASTCSATPGGSLPAPQTIQWQLDGAPITGATSTTYAPATGEVGHALSCHVSQRNLITSAQSDSAASTVAAAPTQAAGTTTPPPAAPSFDIDGFATPPPPVRGKSVIATPTQGTVTVRLPQAKQFIPLPDAERIPVGTVVDARHGVVKLTVVGKNGKLQSAIFYEGEFQIFQKTAKNSVAELRLFGGDFAVCKRTSRTSGALAAAQRVPKNKSIRHLWGSGKGLFRTKGRYASATIRGTRWLTDDRCDGTRIRVAKGTVTVRDLPKKKSLVLKAPKSYLAHP